MLRWIGMGVLIGLALQGTAQTRTLVAYAGAYSNDTVYSVNDMVTVGSEFYISLAANNKGNSPGASAAEWTLVSAGNGTVGGTGAIGPMGPEGPAGPAGATGLEGTAGPAGVAGKTGAIGLTGLTGPAGATGLTGSAGPAGATGAKGTAGSTGPAGPMGLTGAAGPMGLMGLTGAAGAVGPAGPAGAAGPAGGNGGSGTGGGTPGVVRETRTFSVYHIKGQSLPKGGILTLFSATGPGNIERIQIAANYNSETPLPANTVLTIAVDGQTYSCSLGMFMLWNGYFTTDGVAATKDLFVTKYLGITEATSVGNENISGYRRIYIKYNTSINISINVPTTVFSGWWTQVEYYPGVAPAGRYPATRNVFHMLVNEWGPLAPNQWLAVLPTVTGAGELESIYFMSSEPAAATLNGEPQWLEQNPLITVDGTLFWYGGTEDFFGNQFYGDQWQGRTDEYGIGRHYYNSAESVSTTYWSGYRYFVDSPMVFNNSIGMEWQNAGPDSGPATQVGSLAVYYTTQ